MPSKGLDDSVAGRIARARGTIRILRDTDDAQDYSGPLVVLTSRSSASAAGTARPFDTR